MEDALTFAQLSDPHLSSPEGARWRDLANKRLLGYLSWRRRRRAEHRVEVLDALKRDLLGTCPGHLVITGDLTQIALPDEFRQARAWLDSLGSPGEVTVVPGNHDAYVPVPWAQGLSRWQPYLVSDDAPGDGRADSAESVFPSLRVRGPVAFIGLSSARPTAPLLATGRLGGGQLERLERLLEQTRSQGLFRVVLLHHPPVPGEERWRKRLTDAAQLMRRDCPAGCGTGASRSPAPFGAKPHRDSRHPGAGVRHSLGLVHRTQNRPHGAVPPL